MRYLVLTACLFAILAAGFGGEAAAVELRNDGEKVITEHHHGGGYRRGGRGWRHGGGRYYGGGYCY